jgi:hypothetical protein
LHPLHPSHAAGTYIGPPPLYPSLLAVAASCPVAHPDRMSATLARQQGSPLGVALYGALLAVSLILAVLCVALVMTAVERNAPPTILVATIFLVVGTGGLSVYAGVGLYYQAKPVPRSTVQASLVWRPPPLMRAATVVMLVSIITNLVAIAITPGKVILPVALVILAAVGVLACLFGARLLVARLEANRWGIRCTNPFTTIRVPWSEVQSLDPRGRSALSQRIVAITVQRRERMLWVWDPRVPVSRDTARILVAELEVVRQLAAKPDA